MPTEEQTEKPPFEYRPQGLNVNPVRMKKSLDHVGLEVEIHAHELPRLLERLEALEKWKEELDDRLEALTVSNGSGTKGPSKGSKGGRGRRTSVRPVGSGKTEEDPQEPSEGV